MVMDKYPMFDFAGGSRGSVSRSFASLEDKFGGYQQEENDFPTGKTSGKKFLLSCWKPKCGKRIFRYGHIHW